MILGELTDQSLEHLAEAVNAAENPVKFLAIDPGKANGVCGYDVKYHMLFTYTIKSNDMTKFLNVFKHIEVCVIEDFTLYPNKAKDQVYSDMETSRIIGRVEGWAEDNNVKLVKQGAKIKPTGYAWTGKKPLPKSNPLNHELDAHIHFMYWAVRDKRINAAGLL